MDISSVPFLTNHDDNSHSHDFFTYYMQIQDHYFEMMNETAFVSANVGPEVPAIFGSSSSSSSGQHHHHHRRLWVKERPKDWWERCNHPDFPEEEFRRSFRMSKSTFKMICDELNSAVTKKNTTLRDAIPVRQRVAVCVWSLATGDSLRLVSGKFGLGVSTCHKLVLEVCSAIKTVLMPKFIHWPDESKMKMIMNEYELISGGIPNIGGSMYTTHVPINSPKANSAEYFNKIQTSRNQRTCYSIAVQGVVDPQGIITDVFIGGPGSMNNDQVLEMSGLNQRAKMGHLNDVWIVGNSGFSLTDWVLVPYYNKTKQNSNLTWTQYVFNERIREIQKVAKEAFGRLKGRWGCLKKRREMKLEDLNLVIGACCVLHNICEMRNEEMDPEWKKFEVFDDEVEAEDDNMRSANYYSVMARDYIAYNLLHHCLARGTSCSYS
ncbi:hypothetical protein QN277_007363 [Acacia crassicarpa]|uniref:DDE Tnp4 domain-containing protein n=1 Tax=Acacia crassicarpa TaxID=499986 RepID=A0AAE1M8R7_9FABA|nr:hypothetical protein QN277_007363 [Acacia crassicarpa]